MKEKWFVVFLVCCFLGLALQPGCKTAGGADYVLTVTVATGVTGTPATGSYTYGEGEVVSYAYSAQAGYENLAVQLDGVTVGTTGVVTMSANHILNVTVDERFDPSGTWSGYLTNSGVGEFAMTNFIFSGNYLTGTVSGDMDSVPVTSHGEYTITNGSIEINLSFTISGIDFIMDFSGTIENDNRMSGEFTSNFGPAGPWYLNRD